MRQSANLRFFVIMSFITTLVLKIHKMHKHIKIYKIDIVNNLWCFDNK